MLCHIPLRPAAQRQGKRKSHGCVDLPYAFARALFAITNLGITVIVQGGAADHVRTSENCPLAPFDAKGQPAIAAP
jgi:hypothetical protein